MWQPGWGGVWGKMDTCILREINLEYSLEGLAEAEAPILWPPDVKSQLTGKDPDAEKGWRQKKKGATEEEMVRLHHWLNGHEFEQTLGDSAGQGSLALLQSLRLQRVGLDLATKQQGYMYMYGWVPLPSSWNYHNIVNRLYSNTKQKVKKKRKGCYAMLSHFTRVRLYATP